MDALISSPKSPERRDVTRLLEAASDPMRLSIVFLLAAGPLNAGDIANRISRITRPAVSHHLRILRDAGIVDSEKRGQEVYYWLERERIVNGLRGVADAIESCCTPDSKG